MRLMTLLFAGFLLINKISFADYSEADVKMQAENDQILHFLESENPFNLERRNKLVQNYIKIEDYENAKRHALVASRLRPNDPYLAKQNAVISNKLKEFDQTVHWYNKTLNLAKNDFDLTYVSLVGLMKGYYELGHYKKSLSIFGDLKKIDDEFDSAAENIVFLGELFSKSGKVKELEKLVLDHIENRELKIVLLGFYFEQRNFEKAISLSQNFLKDDPSNTEVRKILAKSFLAVKNLESAEDELRMLSNLLAEDISILKLLGQVLFYQSKFDQAGPVLKKCYEMNSSETWCKDQYFSLLTAIDSDSHPISERSVASLPSKPVLPQNVEATAVSASVKNSLQTFELQAGETLQKLSFRIFGTHHRWKEIFEVNKDTISSPHQVFPGMIVKVRVSSKGNA